MRLLQCCPTLLLGVILSSSWLNASEPSAIVVRVEGPRGVAISAARVSTVDEGAFCTTELDGQCTLRASGVSQLTVTARGYAPRQIEVQADDPPLRIVLESLVQSIRVTAEAGSVSLENAATNGSRLSAEQVDALPVWLRNVSALLITVPAVVPRPTQDDLGAGISAAGSRTTMTNFVLDGAPNRSERRGGPALNPSLDSLAEAKVLTSGYSAEYGTTPGAQVIMTSKSGSDQFHGSMFNYARDRFGGTLGGPAGFRSSYFFLSFEGANTDFGDEVTTKTPSLSWLSGDLSSARAAGKDGRYGNADDSGRVLMPLRGMAPAEFVTPNVIPDSMVSPLFRRLSSILPSSPSGVLRSKGEHSRDRLYMLRLDHQIDRSSRVMLRGGRQQLRQVLEPDTAPGMPPSWPVSGVVANSAMASFSRYSPGQELILRVSYMDEPSQDLPSCHVDPRFSISLGSGRPTAGCPIVSIEGFDTFGDAFSLQSFRYQNLQVAGDFSSEWRSVALKVGWAVSRSAYVLKDPTQENGYLYFSGGYTGLGFGDFLLGMPSTALRAESKARDAQQAEFSGYAQVRLRLTPGLDLDLGVRLSALPQANSRTADFKSYARETGLMLQGRISDLLDASGFNYDPRIGVSWRPRHEGTLTIRGGYGIFTGQDSWSILLKQLAQAIEPRSHVREVAGQPAVDPITPTWTMFTNSTQRGVERFNRLPSMHHYNLQIETALPFEIKAELGFIGSRGRNLGRIYNLNMLLPSGLLADGTPVLRRPNPNVGDVLYSDQRARSSYNSAQVRVMKRDAKGIDIDMSYILSKSLDDASGMQERNWTTNPYAQDVRHLEREYGPSNFDHRHQISGRVIVRADRYLKSSFFRASQLSLVLNVMSGIPYTATYGLEYRPDLVGDPYSNIPAGHYFNPAAFARHVPTTAEPHYFGNAGRNSLYGPWFRTVDIAFNKPVKIAQRFDLNIRAECFNVLNIRVPHVNNWLNLPWPGTARHYMNEERHIVAGGRISF